jgi:hypothetical protein
MGKSALRHKDHIKRIRIAVPAVPGFFGSVKDLPG